MIMDSNTVSPEEILKLIHSLKDQEAARRSVLPDGRLDPQLKTLRAWQWERLRRTYADFLTDPGYRPACLFVLDELYAPRDFSQRDRDAEHILAILSRYLPERALALLSGSIYLTRLTNALDQELLQVLLDQPGKFEQIDELQYVQAYVKCDNYDQRVEQIHLVYALMNQAVQGSRSLVFRTGLRLSKTPLEKLGWLDLHTFLDRGAQASKRLPNVRLFLDSIRSREMAILDRIYNGVPDPFNWQNSTGRG